MPTVHEVRDLRDSICGHLEILAHLASIGNEDIVKEVQYALSWITSESIGYAKNIQVKGRNGKSLSEFSTQKAVA